MLEGDGIAGASVALLLAITLGPGGVATGLGPRLAPVLLPMVTAILQFLSPVGSLVCDRSSRGARAMQPGHLYSIGSIPKGHSPSIRV